MIMQAMFQVIFHSRSLNEMLLSKTGKAEYFYLFAKSVVTTKPLHVTKNNTVNWHHIQWI
jgi:hypothetical protein